MTPLSVRPLSAAIKTLRLVSPRHRGGFDLAGVYSFISQKIWNHSLSFSSSPSSASVVPATYIARPTPFIRPYVPCMFFTTTSSQMKQDDSSYPVQKSDGEWQAILTPQQFRVLRGKGTEGPFTGEYEYHRADGVYHCAACDAPLYQSSTKFDSGCGWPAFFDAIPGSIKRIEDRSLGMVRTEMVCANCGGHLGHIFKGEGFKTPTDERHCVNSISLKFKDTDS
ncbi:Mss4-like protein [Lipomyces kononenkoae]